MRSGASSALVVFATSRQTWTRCPSTWRCLPSVSSSRAPRCVVTRQSIRWPIETFQQTRPRRWRWPATSNAWSGTTAHAKV
jgi:hypothetical protein